MLHYKTLKRGLDIIFALLLLIVGIPIIAIASIFIKLGDGGPAFYTQERIGYHNQKFTIYKLRTMKLQSHAEDGRKLRDRERVTNVGKIIRKLSLDELPQLFNIIKGEMSFIGPRPLLVQYLPYYTEEEIHRHDVLPGITGLAQVNGRGFLSWEERFKYDLEYVNNLSLAMDIHVLIQTIVKVFSTEGTSAIKPEGLVDFDKHRNYQKLR